MCRTMVSAAETFGCERGWCSATLQAVNETAGINKGILLHDYA